MINIKQILENAPHGIELYSPISGKIFLSYTDQFGIRTYNEKGMVHYFDDFGRSTVSGECLLFPEKNHQTWKNWQKHLFPKSVGKVILCSDGVYYKIVSGDSATDLYGNRYFFLSDSYDDYIIQPRYATEIEQKKFDSKFNKEPVRIEKGKYYRCIKTWTGKAGLYKEGNVYESDEDGFLVADDGTSYPWPSPRVTSFHFEEFFKEYHVGDVIKHNSEYYIYKIVEINDNTYTCEDEFTVNNDVFEQAVLRKVIRKDTIHENYHRWTIADASDGDVLATKRNRSFIYNGVLDKDNGMKPCAYCGIDSCDGFIVSGNSSNHWTNNDVRPATRKEICILYTEMEKAGYLWDGNSVKRISTEPKPKFSVDDFKPFDKVIVRNGKRAVWVCSFYSHYDTVGIYRYVCTGCGYKQCLPYNADTQHLIGTTEEYNGSYKTWD